MDMALRLECKYMTKLVIDGTTRNMVRTLFVNKTRCEKLFRRPEGVPKAEFKRIGVMGAGLMGAGIAQVAARAGIDVVLLDRDAAAAVRGKEGIAKRLGDAVAKGRLDASKAEQALARITPAGDAAALRGAQLVVEAVFEKLEIEHELLKALEDIVSETCILASNTKMAAVIINLLPLPPLQHPLLQYGHFVLCSQQYFSQT